MNWLSFRLYYRYLTIYSFKINIAVMLKDTLKAIISKETTFIVLFCLPWLNLKKK